MVVGLKGKKCVGKGYQGEVKNGKWTYFGCLVWRGSNGSVVLQRKRRYSTREGLGKHWFGRSRRAA